MIDEPPTTPHEQSDAPDPVIADARDFMDFVAASPTPRHVVSSAMSRLTEAGFVEVGLDEIHSVRQGALARNGSMIAWRLPDAEAQSPRLRVIAAHTDSPNLRVKPSFGESSDGVLQLGVEQYGGMLRNSWLDRDLGLAGHVVVRKQDRLLTQLVDLERPVMRIPQLAIHLDREVTTKGLTLNAQKHLSPVVAIGVDPDLNVSSLLASELEVGVSQIVAFELMAYPTEAPSLSGWYNQFLSAPRIDNQLSCWAAVEALIAARPHGTQVVALFDHEEVGSVSRTGADAVFLSDCLNLLLQDGLPQAVAGDALCVSADCAHATHPNYPDRHDESHRISLGAGPVIKINASQRYATTALGHAMVVAACEEAEVPYQVFVSRSDLACGSTVGPVVAARTGLETVDFGAPQLGMHSARETTGTSDPYHMRAALEAILVDPTTPT